MTLEKWMKDIDSKTNLLSLNIPGTHDCVTRYVQFYHICNTQDLSIREQLLLGIRALDIRVEAKGDRLKMVHGFAKAYKEKNRFKGQMDLSDVLEQCYEFLEENPSEAIVFQFKNDSGKKNEKCFDNLFEAYIKGNEEKWFLENRVPTLEEARGKIFLIRRCKMAERAHYNNENTGLDFSKWVEQTEAIPTPLFLMTHSKDNAQFLIQDRFKYKPEPRWSECIKPFLDGAEKFNGAYIINYISTAGGLKGPRKNAQYINPKFIDYPLKKDLYYGTIYCDFPSKELTEKIISLNFS